MHGEDIPDGLCGCGCGATPNPGRKYIHGHNPSWGRPEDRFWKKVDKGGPHGCWEWTGARNAGGYGLFKGRTSTLAHRFAYEALVAPIPEGLVIDHLCRNRACVNPAHMEIVTSGVNVLRGLAPSSINARKTHCIHGHEFTPENTHWRIEGGRACRTCGRESSRRRDARNRRKAA